jgi:hypothetical protein
VAEAEYLEAYAPGVLGNRTVGAISLLAVCGGITMVVNLLVMDARAGHIGEISSNNERISAPADSIAEQSASDRTPAVALLGAVITAPGITAAAPVIAPTASTSALTTNGDD